jgi:hypothetical protein
MYESWTRPSHPDADDLVSLAPLISRVEFEGKYLISPPIFNRGDTIVLRPTPATGPLLVNASRNPPKKVESQFACA